MSIRLDDYPIEFIDGISFIIDRYDAFLSDIWGVLHDGVRLYPGVRDCLQNLRKNHKKIILLSNSARLAGEVKKQIAGLGLTEDLYDSILSSGELTKEVFLSGSDPQVAELGTNFFLLGPEKYRLASELDLHKTDDLSQADFLFTIGVTGNPTSTIEMEPLLREAADKNLPMVCANPDVHVVRDGIKGIGSGALAACYETLGGEVIYFGKPYRAIYDRCLQLLDMDMSRVVAVGDSLKTDIAGASSNGLDSILVASGIHAHDLETVPDDCTGLASLLRDEPYYPTMAARGFYW